MERRIIAYKNVLLVNELNPFARQTKPRPHPSVVLTLQPANLGMSITREWNNVGSNERVSVIATPGKRFATVILAIYAASGSSTIRTPSTSRSGMGS
jgi:hypothetical protein